MFSMLLLRFAQKITRRSFMRNSESVRILAVIIMALFMPSVILAQADPVDRPISVSCVPGFSSNGPTSYSVTTNFSINILGGLNRRVHGCEIGGLFNIEKEEVIGFQAAGVGSFVGADLVGAQIAGVVNVVGGYASGFQAAGVGNFVGSDFAGFQGAGVFNMVVGDFDVAQVAGVANIAEGEVRGVQIAGPFNFAEGNSGVQIAVVNISGEVIGGQIGVVNIARKVTGFQLGLVNVAEEMTGVPLGLVSIVGNGQFHVNAWFDETSILNVGLKCGSKHAYTVVEYGINPLGDYANNKLGLGVGGHIPADPLFVDIDAVGYSVVEGILPVTETRSSLLARLRVTGGWQISPKLAVTLGPTLNVWHSTEEDGSDIPLFDLLIYEHQGENTWTRIWAGFSVGVQLL